MSIPAAVRAQAEAADRALDAASKANVSDVAPANPEAPVVTSPASDHAAVQTPNQPASAEPVAEGDDRVDRQVYLDILHRYKTAQGMFGNLKAKISALEQEIADLKANRTQGAGQGASAGSDAKPHLKLLTEEERNDFGDHVLDVNARVAQGVVDNALAKIKADAAREAQRTTEEETTKAAADVFWTAVEAEFPGAMKIDAEDPRWWQFMSEAVEPVSGQLYGELAQNAARRGNVSSLVRILEAFVESVGGRMISGAVSGKLKPRMSRSAPVTPTEGRVVPESEIRAFYTDVSKGKYVQDPAAARAKEAEYEKAAQEGRIALGA